MADLRPRLSALILARDEAHNLADCVIALGFADEIIIVVDPRSQDSSEAVAHDLADRVLVRPFDDFASQRNAALEQASGDWVLAVDADERATPELGREIGDLLASNPEHTGYRVPIRSMVLGRSFRYSGTQHDLPLRLFRRDRGRWVGEVHENGETGWLARSASPRAGTSNLARRGNVSRQDRPLHDVGGPPVSTRKPPDPRSRPDGAAGLDVRQALSGKTGISRRSGRVDVLSTLGGFGRRAALEASGIEPRSVLDMTSAHETFVYARFDALEARFRTSVASSDVRLRAISKALGPIAGQTVLDLGCGKGRFARHLHARGANIVGLDASRGMLGGALGLDRVCGSALRLPFASESFDGIAAVEVFEHLPPRGLDRVIAEAARVLRPGGVLAVVDKNALSLNPDRPYLPGVLVKAIDRRRGRWMYPQDYPVGESWFRPGALARRLRKRFQQVSIQYLLSPNESSKTVFRQVPVARRMVLWTATKAVESP